MTIEDNRTPEQQLTHRYAVIARDKCMSGWGGARGGSSRCAWTCETLGQANVLLAWVRSRSEMKNVNIHFLPTYRIPRGTAHFHIYLVRPTHPAFNAQLEYSKL